MTKLVTNKQYNKAKNRWQLVRDVVDDEVSRKACWGANWCADSSDAGLERGYIIRDPNISEAGYRAFARRAVFKNYTGNTLDTLLGAAFFKPFQLTGPEGSDLPPSIDYIEEDFTGSGVSYSDSLRNRMRENASVGRGAILVEVPGTAQGRTRAEIRNNNILAQAKFYEAEQTTDWSTKVINGKERLNYVRLEEEYEEVVRDGDGFKRLEYNIVKEAYLDEDGFYALIVDDNNDVTEYTPTLGNGKRLDFIPCQFYGSQDNTPNIDISPMFKLSEINIGVYNTDAELRQNIHYFACPTVAFGLNDNVSIDEFKKFNGLKDGESPSFGATAYVGCDINLAQPMASDLTLNTMDKDVEGMAQIGAQIITVGQNETAEAARIKKSSSMASLSDIVGNIESGDRNVIRWMMMINNESGQPDEFELQLNKKFYDDKMSPQELQQKFAMVSAGKYPLEYLFNELKEQGSGIPTDHNYQDMLELTGSDTGGKPINPDIDENGEDAEGDQE